MNTKANAAELPEVKFKYVDIKLVAVRTSSKLSDLTQIQRSSDAAHVFRGVFDAETMSFRESAYIMGLNRSNRVIGVYKIADGSIDKVIIDHLIAAKVLVDLMAQNAILCHNHPSGNLQMSKADLDITISLSKALKCLDINLLDHIVLTQDGYTSYADTHGDL